MSIGCGVAVVECFRAGVDGGRKLCCRVELLELGIYQLDVQAAQQTNTASTKLRSLLLR